MLRWMIGGFTAMLMMAVGAGMMTTIQTVHASSTEKIVWHRFDEGFARAQREKKFLLVDFYTDWCGWCNVMEEKTYADPGIQARLRKSFIPVKVNAESQKTLKVQGKTITETRLASIFQVRSYPATWFIDPDGKPIAPVSGYVPPDRFEPILTYIGDGWYKKMPFDQFTKRVSD